MNKQEKDMHLALSEEMLWLTLWHLSLFPLRPKPFLFKGDHKYPASSPESPVVILYAEIGSEEFYRHHRRLVAKAQAGEITYVLRHYIAVSTFVHCNRGIWNGVTRLGFQKENWPKFVPFKFTFAFCCSFTWKAQSCIFFIACSWVIQSIFNLLIV